MIKILLPIEDDKKAEKNYFTNFYPCIKQKEYDSVQFPFIVQLSRIQRKIKKKKQKRVKKKLN